MLPARLADHGTLPTGATTDCWADLSQHRIGVRLGLVVSWLDSQAGR